MSKAFLSHSSKDKPLVEKIARQLGRNNCHYDNLTFEAGHRVACTTQLLYRLQNRGTHYQDSLQLYNPGTQAMQVVLTTKVFSGEKGTP